MYWRSLVSECYERQAKDDIVFSKTLEKTLIKISIADEELSVVVKSIKYFKHQIIYS